jgi:hypothetical protein
VTEPENGTAEAAPDGEAPVEAKTEALPSIELTEAALEALLLSPSGRSAVARSGRSPASTGRPSTSASAISRCRSANAASGS